MTDYIWNVQINRTGSLVRSIADKYVEYKVVELDLLLKEEKTNQDLSIPKEIIENKSNYLFAHKEKHRSQARHKLTLNRNLFFFFKGLVGWREIEDRFKQMLANIAYSSGRSRSTFCRYWMTTVRWLWVE